MAALLIRLNLLLIYRLFRSSVANTVGLVVIVLYGAGALLAMVAGALFLREADPHNIGWVTTTILALVAVGWPAVEALGGTMDPLNPPRFALLPVRARDLQPGLALATLLSLEGVAVLVLVVAHSLAWSRHPIALLWAAIGGVLGLAMAVVSCRLAVTYWAARMASRRSQDRLMMAVAVLMLLFVGVALLVNDAFTDDGSITFSLAGVERAAPIVAWTPFGWAWSLPWDAAAGVWWGVAAKTALSLAGLAAAWWAWGRLLDKALTSPFEIGGATSKVDASERGFSRLLPQGPVGAIARRTIKYWARDPRRKMQAILAVMMPVLFTFTVRAWSEDAHSAIQLLAPLAAVALMSFTWVMGELIYDGGAVWHQIAAGVSGRADRWGRLVGLGALVVPYALVLCVGYLAWTGLWRYSALLLVVMTGLLGVIGGVGSWVGAVWTYPVPPPGLTFNSSRGGLAGLAGFAIGSMVQGVLLLPILIAAFVAYSNPGWLLASALVIVGVGAASLWGGVRLGASYLDGQWPETLARVTWAKR